MLDKYIKEQLIDLQMSIMFLVLVILRSFACSGFSEHRFALALEAQCITISGFCAMRYDSNSALLVMSRKCNSGNNLFQKYVQDNDRLSKELRS
jgi:hypothetical protein